MFPVEEKKLAKGEVASGTITHGEETCLLAAPNPIAPTKKLKKYAILKSEKWDR